MMAEKARLFEDSATRAAILAEMHPLRQKNLASRKGTLRGFDQKVWDRECFDVVVSGNRAKFQQNEDLREVLLATGQKVLVEASPQDPIWGVGLTPMEAKNCDPASWPG